MDKTDRLRDYGLAFLLYEQGLGICGYELIRELFIFIKLILNSYLVILFIFLGILVGYNVRTRIKSATRKSTIGTWAGRATTGLIWLLLFMLGIEVGSNDQIISALPTLGVEALVLSGFATLGSCALAWALWKTAKGGKER